MVDFEAAPGGGFALEALAVGALVFVAGRAYRLDAARRFVREASADGVAFWGEPVAGGWSDGRDDRVVYDPGSDDDDDDWDDEDDGDWDDDWSDAADDDDGAEPGEAAHGERGSAPALTQARGRVLGLIAARAGEALHGSAAGPGADARSDAEAGAGWIPACAGMTDESGDAGAEAVPASASAFGLRADARSDAVREAGWIPACAGMTDEGGAAGVEPTPAPAPTNAPDSDTAPMAEALLASVLDLLPWTPASVPPDGAEGGHMAFTPLKKVRFVEALAESGNVRHACAQVGISRHTAYKARRRDGVLAQAWLAALGLAAQHVDAVVGERALDGVEEPVFWKGELVGTRRRYDTRLLLAHLARMEGYAAQRPVAQAADRFDELLALLGGQAVDPALRVHHPTFMEGGVPVYRRDHVPGLAIPREEWCAHAQRYAEEGAAMAEIDDPDYAWDDEEWADCTGAASDAARREAEARWDSHYAAVLDYVDALDADRDGAAVMERVGFELTGGPVRQSAPAPVARVPGGCDVPARAAVAGEAGHGDSVSGSQAVGAEGAKRAGQPDRAGRGSGQTGRGQSSGAKARRRALRRARRLGRQGRQKQGRGKCLKRGS